MKTRQEYFENIFNGANCYPIGTIEWSVLKALCKLPLTLDITCKTVYEFMCLNRVSPHYFKFTTKDNVRKALRKLCTDRIVFAIGERDKVYVHRLLPSGCVTGRWKASQPNIQVIK